MQEELAKLDLIRQSRHRTNCAGIRMRRESRGSPRLFIFVPAASLSLESGVTAKDLAYVRRRYIGVDAYADLQLILGKPIDWELVRQQYDQMIKYTTALRLGTAETEAILRRFTKHNVVEQWNGAMGIQHWLPAMTTKQ